MIYDGDQFIDIPPYGIDLMDSTGAGDTYMAGFTFEYLRTGGDLRRAGCYGSCTSSVMIENSGPDFSMTDDMILKRQATLLKLTERYCVVYQTINSGPLVEVSAAKV